MKKKRHTPPMGQAWIDGVLDVGERTAKDPGSHDFAAHDETDLSIHGYNFPLTLLRSTRFDDQYIWIVRAPRSAKDRVVASGKVEGPVDGHFTVSTAAVRQGWRRQGIYQAVLRYLRKTLGPIRSDASMTAGAVGAWSKLGAELVGQPSGQTRYRINPRRNGSSDVSVGGWLAILGGAVVAAILLRELVGKPIDAAMGR